MKKILTLAFFVCFFSLAYAQTDGITYQAVIIAPDDLELPGVDSPGNYLPNTTIAIRFTIYDEQNQLEFQEVQTTETDEFGRINLLIGDGNHDYFKEMNWNGTPKDLKVEIDFEAGSNFEEMSRERLTFLPYAFHRNITATGTLTVDDRTYLNGELQVEGPTNLSSTLDVNNGNATNLTGTLNVDGITDVNNAFNVNNGSLTNLTGNLNVDGSSLLNSTLDVIGLTTLNDLVVNGEASFGDLTAENLKVTDSTHLDGGLNITSDSQVKISSSIQGSDLNIKNYPLLVEGGNQGIAIKVNAVGALNQNNFVSFWDETPVGSVSPHDLEAITGPIEDVFELVGLDTSIFDDLNAAVPSTANTVSGEILPDTSGPMLWGRIEGETNESEFSNNADYNLEKLSVIYDFTDGTLDLAWQLLDNIAQGGDFAAAVSSSTGCFGLGTCVTAPIPSIIINETADNVIMAVKTIAAVANQVFSSYMLFTFNDNKVKYRGVSYASGAGDYAEYLERLNVNEVMSYGDIVGVNGGKISKNTSSSQRMMVISYKPAVLGALPQPSEEHFYEKVAFMGQVPVKVLGKVNIGDYILPSGNNDGLGIAVSPNKITIRDIKNIVGIAWESSENQFSINLINTAVGINNNDNNTIVEKLENEVLAHKNEIEALKELLTKTIDRIDNIENGTIALGQNTNSSTQTDNIAHDGRHYEEENGVIYFEVSDEEIEKAMVMAEKMMNESDISKSQNFIWKKINEDPEFKQNFINKIRESMDKHIHYHKEVNKETRH